MINTPDDWWKLLEEHWANIVSIFSRFLPVNEPVDYEDNLVGTLEPMNVLIERAKQDRDHYTLLRYLNAAWWAAPDKPWIHDIPSWGVLCDLCSEECVFEEGEA